MSTDPDKDQPIGDPVLARFGCWPVVSPKGTKGLALVMTTNKPGDPILCNVLESWEEVQRVVGDLFSKAKDVFGEPSGQGYLYDPSTGKVEDVPDDKGQH